MPRIVQSHVPAAIDAFLAAHGLTRDRIGAWVMRPGGPKVIDAMVESLWLDEAARAPTRESLRRVGNLSSSGARRRARRCGARS